MDFIVTEAQKQGPILEKKISEKLIISTEWNQIHIKSFILIRNVGPTCMILGLSF